MNQRSTSEPRYTLKIGDRALDDAYIEELIVRQELGAHWWCDVAFSLGRKGRPPFEGYLGKALEFVVYGDGVAFTLFKGFVLEGEMEYGLHESYRIRIAGVTKSYKLQLTPEEDYFFDQTLQEVAQRVIEEDGLQLSFNVDGGLKRMNYVQWGDTDFDFIKRLADDEGCFLRPTDEGLEIRRGFQDLKRTLPWHVEGGLLKFSLKGRLGQPTFDGTTYVFEEMRSQSYRKVKEDPLFFGNSARGIVEAVKTESGKQMPSSRMNFDGRAPNLEVYQTLLKKESARSIGSKIVGQGWSQDYRLKPGDQIRLVRPAGTEGEGFDADGDYGLIGVIHTYNPRDGYRNVFTATPWKGYTAAEQPPRALVHGVVPARVTNIEDDKCGACRIRVRYDWMDSGVETGWIRMTTPCAGGGRGIMFRPQIGDEVLVAFTHGDPERPYAVGALWNGIDRSPAKVGFWGHADGQEALPEEIAAGDICRIVTKSGNVIQLIDVKDKEAITISTRNGQKIQIIESCEETNGRQMLCLTSPGGDIYLHAPEGRVHIKSKFFSKEIG
ncbi:MAG TPA: phage baseplate assembly protein V [Blastocatellia bacterium]|nr:phage baseplate assembly protein V [Blastocatellia bacterium]